MNYDSIHPFPSENIPFEKRDSEWYKNYSIAIYSRYINDQCGIAFNKKDLFAENRAYAEGSQDPEKYMDVLLGKKKNPYKSDRKGYWNVNWDIFSPAPKYMDILHGMLEDVNFRIQANAIDEKAVDEKDDIKWEKWFRKQYPKIQSIVENDLGGGQGQDNYVPESIEELEMYQNMGGIKLKREMALEMGIEHGFYISNWKEDSRKIREDLIVNGWGAARDYTCPYTQKAKTRYVDISKLVIQYSRSNNFDNAEYAGEIITVPISVLRKETNLKEDELRSLASDHMGKNGNPSGYSFDPYDNYDSDMGCYGYDEFQVSVLDAVWKSNISKYYTKKKREGQSDRYYREERAINKKTKDKESVKSDVTVICKAKWIIGTDNVYDYGLDEDIVREGKRNPKLPYKCYRLKGKSFIERIKTNLDQIQLSWLYLQNAKAMARNSGVAIEFSSLQNMTIGGKTDPLDLMKIYNAKGDIIYRATTNQGRYMPNAARPITEMQGGIGRRFNELIGDLEMNFGFISELLGIDRISAASKEPSADTPVGTVQIAATATSNAIKPIISGFVDIKEHLARSLSLRIIDIIKFSGKDYKGSYKPIFGESGVKAIKITSDVCDSEYGIKLQMLPDRNERMEAKRAAIEAMKPGKDGVASITYSDYMFLTRMIEYGNIKYAEALLAHKEEKRRREARAHSEKITQMQTEGNMKQKQAENAAKVAEIKLKGEEERKTKVMEGDVEKENERLKHELKMKEITREALLERRAERVDTDSKTKNKE